MKIWKHKFLKQMIIIITLIFLIVNCIATPKTYATKATESGLWDVGEWLLGTTQWVSRLSVLGSIVPTEDTAGNTVQSGGLGGNLIMELVKLVVGLGDAGIALLQVSLLGDMRFLG